VQHPKRPHLGTSSPPPPEGFLDRVVLKESSSRSHKRHARCTRLSFNQFKCRAPLLCVVNTILLQPVRIPLRDTHLHVGCRLPHNWERRAFTVSEHLRTNQSRWSQTDTRVFSVWVLNFLPKSLWCFCLFERVFAKGGLSCVRKWRNFSFFLTSWHSWEPRWQQTCGSLMFNGRLRQ